MKTRILNYHVMTTLLIGVCTVLIGLTEVGRIHPELQNLYLFFKLGLGTSLLALAGYFYFFGTNDLSVSIMLILSLSYPVIFMWFAPLYEVSYLEIGLACCFMQTKRSWIFPTIISLSGIGILSNYFLQNQLSWTLPPILVSDGVWITVQCFLISLFIHNFVIKAYKKEKDRMIRFSLVGKETSKVIHDIKGMLSTPLLILDNLKDYDKKMPPESYNHQLQLLAHDLHQVSEMAKSINRLVVVNDTILKIKINSVISDVLQILQRRLRQTRVDLPEERTIETNKERLQSVIFNLLLNSIEAFEREKVQDRHIKIYWKKNTLAFEDNAGGLKKSIYEVSSKGSGSRLGLELIKLDVEKMKASLSIKTIENSVLTEIKFRS